MPKHQRLSRADFASISAARSRRFFGTYFSLSVGPLPSGAVAQGPKCACVVSKKVAKNATDRNLIKRRCREACRTVLAIGKHGLQNHASLVFYAKKEAKGAPFKEIEKDVMNLLGQIR
jgi:ribonuclease P protein component